MGINNNEKLYKEKFNVYKNKIKLLDDGDEYILNSIYTNNGKTFLNLTHTICNSEYICDQYKFIKGKNRCQNPSCIHERKRNNILKTTEEFKNEVFKLVGDEYIVLTEYIGKDNNVKFLHKKCGDTFVMSPHNFLNGQRCVHCSYKPTKLEKIIINWLNECKINFTFQKYYDDLKSEKGYPLSYDFFIKDFNKLIEVQGFFHTDKSIKKKLRTEEQYKYRVKCDEIKRSYAKNNNIELLEIWEEDIKNESYKQKLIDFLNKI